MGTTSDKLTYLNDTKTQIRDGINALGGDLTEEDTFRSYANELDNMWEELPHSTGEGETLSLNTKKGKMKVNLLGNTSQTGTPTPSSPIPVNVVSGDNTIVSTGKNLLEPKLPTYTRYGITCTNNGDGSFTLNGTATQNSDFRLDQSLPSGADNLKNYNGTYTLSCNELTNGLQLRLMQNQTWATLLAMIDNNTPVTATFNKDNCFIYANVTNGVTVNNLTIRPMLELGSNATSYEPYTSTSYPIHLGEYELCKISTYQDRFIRTTGKNLLDVSKIVNGYWYLDGVLTGNNNWSYVNQQIPVKPNTAYTLSRDSSSTTASQFSIEEFDSNGNFVKHNAMWQNTGIHTYTITMQPTTAYVYCQWNNTYSYSDIMFEEGSSRTSYEPYGTNEWYLEKKIGKYTFTGNENNMSLQNNGKRIYIGTKASSIPEPLHTTSTSQKFGMYSNKLVEVTAGQTWGGTQGVSYDYNSGENTGNFDISINGISTLADYRTAVAGIILYYILQTPTYTPITGTLKDELEAAWRANSYKGTTNISQVNNDLAFELDVEGLSA